MAPLTSCTSLFLLYKKSVRCPCREGLANAGTDAGAVLAQSAQRGGSRSTGRGLALTPSNLVDITFFVIIQVTTPQRAYLKLPKADRPKKRLTMHCAA
jgi:hypothetical protein